MNIIVHLYGGFGNQLFQYSFGEYIRYRYGLSVSYDIASFGVLETYRDYQLSPIVKDLPVQKVGRLFFSRYKTYARYFLRLLYKKKPGVKYICDYEDNFDESIFQSNKYQTIYFDGYWNDKKYAEWLIKNNHYIYNPVEDIPSELTEILEYIKSGEVIALHVRRGDYLKPCNSNLAGACANGYYNKAVDLICSKNVQNAKLLIFSDDNQWVQENLKFDIPSGIVDDFKIRPFWFVYLMSLCKHNVISNSTFSWWGAFLNKYKSKIVVMPSKWYANQDNPPLYVEQWLKI